MRTFAAVVTLGVSLAASLGAAPARAQDRAAMKRSADAAIAAERWCDGLYYYEALDALAPDPKYLFNAAELARAAGDLVQAQLHYRALIERHPAFSEVPAARDALAEIERERATRGPGLACAPPRPVCTNGVVEHNESCDDGNTLAGDGCSAVCALERAAPPPPDVPPEVALQAPPPEVPREEPSEAPAPSGGVSPAIAWGAIGVGSLLAAVGALTFAIGVVPGLDYGIDSALRDNDTKFAVEGIEGTGGTAEEYVRIAGSATERDVVMREDADKWNRYGRFATPVGVALSALGVAAVGTGVALLFMGPSE